MSLRHELRWATRTLSRNPGFTLLVVLTFGVGIALNVIVAAFVDSLLFRAAPGVTSANAVAIIGTDDSGSGVLSYRDLVDYRAQSRTVEHISAWKFLPASARIGEEPMRIATMLVSAGYFEALGVRPARGRFFIPQEDRVPNEVAVAVLADAFWRSRFGAREVVGEEIVINDRPFRIIGIAPAPFRGTAVVDRADVFVPMMMQPHLMPASGNLLDRRGWSGVYGIGRLRSGVTMDAAQADLATIAARLAKEYPDSNDGVGVGILPLDRAALPPHARVIAGRVATILAIVTFGALFLVCANLANLFLGRAVSRAREIAVRSVLGAGRWGVARQLAVESLLLAIGGAVAGLLLASVTISLLRARIAQFDAVAVTPASALVTIVLAIVCGLACAIVPVFFASSRFAPRALRATAGSTGRETHRISSVLVAVQVAVSVVLLTVSALLALTLRNLGAVALGFETRGVIAAELAVPTRTPAVHDTILERIRATSWVEGAALGSVVPLSGAEDRTQMVREGAPMDEAKFASFVIISPDYFRTVGIPLRRGREFNNSDGPSSSRVVIINESLARRFWPNADPVGKRLRETDGDWMEVVGVAADSRFSEVRSESTPTIYFVHAQADSDIGLSLFVRTSRDTSAAARDLRSVLTSIGVPAGEVAAFEKLRRDASTQERMMSVLIGAVAVLALAISALGLYGVLALSIAQRTREIGVRMALGAVPADLVRSTMLRGAALALAGLVAGSAIVAAGRGLLAPFLFGTRISDPAPWMMVVGFLAVSVLAATYVPARRAARVQPAIALRHE